MTGPAVELGPEFERDYPGASARSTALVLNLVQVADELTNRVAALARGSGIPSSTAMIVLEILRGAGEPLPPYVIAERIFLHRATVTGLLDSLESRGFIERQPHPSDRRMVLIALTQRGHEAIEALVPRLHRAERAWLSAVLQPAEEQALLDLLLELRRGLAATATADGELARASDQREQASDSV